MLCKSLLQESERRRPALEGGATAGGIIATQRLGIAFLTNMNIYRDSHHSSCQHRQRQELAQHTVVRPSCHSRQMAMTIMVYAVSAFRVDCL